MSPTRGTTLRLGAGRVVLLCLGACSAAAALAQESSSSSPYGITLRERLTADTNLFHVPDGEAASRDLASSTSVRLGLDQGIARQRLSAGIEGTLVRYKNNSQLDHTAHDLSARLDWETVERLSGAVTLAQQETLFIPELFSQSPTTEKTLLRNRSAGLQARLGVVTQWTLEAGWAVAQSRYASADFSNRDVQQQSLDGGLRWTQSDAISLRLGGRYTDGRFPNVGSDGDDFKRADLDFGARLAPNDVSSIDARLSLTREVHALQAQRKLNTWTGDLNWNWRPTGKLTVDTRLSRDNSVGRGDAASAVDARIGTSLAVALRWDATAKIQLSTLLSQTQRELDASFANTASNNAIGVTTARDRSLSARLALRYQPLRSIELLCDLARTRRHADASSLGISYPFSATSASCSGQLSLR